MKKLFLIITFLFSAVSFAGLTSVNTLKLNGTSQYLDCGNHADLQITDEILISAWVRLTSKSSQTNIVTKWDSNNNQKSYSIAYKTGPNAFEMTVTSNGSSNTKVVSTTSPSVDVWYHVVGIYNGSHIKIYINGVEEASTGFSSDIYNGSANVLVGAKNGGSADLNGAIASVKILNSSANAATVTELYNNGNPKIHSAYSMSVKNNSVLAIEAGVGIPLTGNELVNQAGASTVSLIGSPTLTGTVISFDDTVSPNVISNSLLGESAGNSNTASGNTFVGAYAGFNNITGVNNVFLGEFAGADETGSNKLYIENTDSASPLIYGEFDNNKVQVNGELRVTNGIFANKVTVDLQANWPDYVFSKDYKLLSLEEVEKHIKEHKHLPGIPSAKEIEKKGTLSVDEVMIKQMEKIEELTLYIIQLKKENDNLKSEVLKRLQALEKAAK